jgi:hypothetical protein
VNEGRVTRRETFAQPSVDSDDAAVMAVVVESFVSGSRQANIVDHHSSSQTCRPDAAAAGFQNDAVSSSRGSSTSRGRQPATDIDACLHVCWS